ncbi:SEL1-like repeat protein [Proteus hauseri]|uniref:SEL1-like repeat protein n=1 Tax=Proteus hauseri TaxID=183417 RepID=UPI0032D9EA1A
MNDTLKNFQFTCVQEKDHFPPLEPEADDWFKEARRLEIKKGPKDFDHIAFLYRQAVEKGHYKAIGNLQNMIAMGQVEPLAGKTRSEEVIDLTEQLIKMDIPFGYYIMGTYLQRGYGVKQDPDAALQYFLKAAVMGNADGQLAIGELFLNGRTPLYRLDLGRTMLKCAAEQGNTNAAYSLAMDYEVRDKDYSQALIFYQLAIRYGHGQSAYQLSRNFNTSDPDNRLDYMGLLVDPERVRRYKMIEEELSSNPRAKFPDIDKIVPLPPAELPKWDGTFEYKKQQISQ